MFIGLFCGMMAGAVVLGVGGRMVMRALAVIAEREVEFSVGGTIEVIAFGAIIGLIAGAAFVAIKKYLPGPAPLKGMSFGLLAFLLNFIPSVGSVVATLLPLPIVLVSPEISTKVAVAAIAVPSAIQLVFGNFLEPKIMGESLDLHPATILLSLILWGTLWGVLGMILSVPITVVVKILCERFEGSRPVADLLAGRTDALVGGT